MTFDKAETLFEKAFGTVKLVPGESMHHYPFVERAPSIYTELRRAARRVESDEGS